MLNTFELNDNPMTFLSPDPTEEGEYFALNSEQELTTRLKVKQDMIYEAVFSMSSTKTEHSRDAFDFLLFLANIGGV